MFIRYQTVRTILIAVVASGATVGLVLCATSDKKEPVPSAPVAVQTSPAPTGPAPTGSGATSPAPRPMANDPVGSNPGATDPNEARMLEVARVMLEERATSEKIKDLFRGSGPKVNIYDDDKDGRWDRAKVDWNRDEIDDEKLNVKNGVLERRDEKSGQIKVFGGGAWTVKAP